MVRLPELLILSEIAVVVAEYIQTGPLECILQLAHPSQLRGYALRDTHHVIYVRLAEVDRAGQAPRQNVTERSFFVLVP